MYTEHKFFDSNFTGQTAVNNSWTSSSYMDPIYRTLFCPSLGYTYYQRIGNKCAVHSIEITVGLCYPFNDINIGALTTQGNQMRLIVFHDSQTNGDRIDAGSVMAHNGSSLDVLQCGINPVISDRIKFLHDELIDFNPSLATRVVPGTPTSTQYGSYNATYLSRKICIKFPRPIIVHFNEENDGDIDDVIDHSFHVFGHALNNPTSIGIPAGIAVTYFSRVMYTDL